MILNADSQNNDPHNDPHVDALLKAQKIETASVVLSGIAHEFNNILMILNGNLELAMIDEDIPEDTMELYTEMKKGIDRAALLVKSMRSVSKCRKGKKQERKISDIIDMAVRGSEDSRKYDFQIIIDSSCEDNQTVLINPPAFTQAFVNVIENSIQAQPGGGKISIKADYVSQSDSNILKITVSDDGCGIQPDVENSIFQPYFTDKQGYLGLGLTASQWIFNNHMGVIEYLGSGPEISSSGLKGAHFLITLPMG